MEVIQLQRLPKREHVLGSVVPVERLADCLDRCLASDVSVLGKYTFGSRMAPMIARMIFIPVTPVMSATTWWSWTFININAFCMCWMCEAA